jgi:hypothetical protein
MHRVILHWSVVNYHSLHNKKNAQIYLFEKNGEIKYIGYCNELSLEKEVKEYLRLFHINPEEVNIWCGCFRQKIDKQITRDLVESAICLMVNQIKPQFNVLCKSGYYGYTNLSVSNKKCSFLPSILTTYNVFGSISRNMATI